MEVTRCQIRQKQDVLNDFERQLFESDADCFFMYNGVGYHAAIRDLHFLPDLKGELFHVS